MRIALFLLFATLLVSSAWAQRASQYDLAVIQDPDGFTNAREGPSTSFPVVREVRDGEVFLVTDWPYPGTREELRRPELRAKLEAAGMDPDRIFEWRYVILLERGEPRGKGGRWAYIHSSRIRTLRTDVSTWAVIDDPDGYTNVRTKPQGKIVGRVTDQDCFVILDDPSYKGKLFQATWYRARMPGGVEGFVKADRVRYHDTRDWQWAGPIPYVDFGEYR